MEYMHGQIRDLLTEFGRVDILWLDFSYPGPDGKGRDDWGSEKLVRMIRELQPLIILNDRLDLPDAWNVKTPEQSQPRGWVTVNGKPVVWEACWTFSGSWGYHRDEASWLRLHGCARRVPNPARLPAYLQSGDATALRSPSDVAGGGALPGRLCWQGRVRPTVERCLGDQDDRRGCRREY